MTAISKIHYGWNPCNIPKIPTEENTSVYIEKVTCKACILKNLNLLEKYWRGLR